MTDVARPGDVLLIPGEVSWSDALADVVLKSIKARCPGLDQVVMVPALGRPVIYRQKPAPGLCGNVMPDTGYLSPAPVCAWPADHPGTWHGTPSDVRGMIPMMWDSRTEPASPPPDRSGEYCLFCDGDRKPERHPGGRDQHGF